ncbi:Acid sphingomyelinase phosphodiesterase 3b [Fasciola gigantica]|uniref:Acid sphingomyelinase phosphodiesterase 3b n=1 Tax=Fasciola gigantica TaxID=46835 RepID=A0A504Z012_FASGI|nr:Acid sphingomyelinase phosphodiesterase 3b [Fasciola gigantica]
MGKLAHLFLSECLAVCILLASKVISSEIRFFLQISDIHLDLDYSNHTCVGTYGDPNCDSPVELLHSAVKATQSLSKTHSPDFVIWSGDNGPHIGNLSTARLQDHIMTVSKTLRGAFPTDKVYILPTVGNHDVFPANQMSPNPHNKTRLSWCHNLGSNQDLWAPWIDQFDPTARGAQDLSEHQQSHNTIVPTAPPWSNFSINCYHSHWLPEHRLLLVSLNGLIWYTGNILSGNAGPDPLGQLDWLNRTFSWARKSAHKIVLVSHFPPGASENSPRTFQFLRPEINDRFVRLLRTNSDLLMVSLFAHEHVDSFRVIFDDKNRPAVSALVAPSVCPLRLRGLGSFNPRIRLYQYDRQTGSLLGYEQYYLDLDLIEKGVQWQLEYDTKTAYGLLDLSPQSMAGLLDRLECDETPDGPWAHYWLHELGTRPHEPRSGYLTPEGLCPRAASRCRCEHLCAMRVLEMTVLRQCLDNCSSYIFSPSFPCNFDASSSQGIERSISTMVSEINGTGASMGGNKGSSLPIIIGVIIAFLAILVGVVLLVNREICQKRGRYGSRFGGPGGSSIGGVIFSTLNGTFPRSTGTNGLHGPQTQCGDSIAGSSTELRVAFQPHYVMDDEFSVITQGTADHDETSPHLLRNSGASLGNSPYKKQLIHGPSGRSTQQQRRLNGHLGSINPLVPGADNPVDSRHSVPDVSRGKQLSRIRMARNTEAVVHHASTENVTVAVALPSAAISNLSCPAEDYYADDEQAFGDDELEEEEDDEQSDVLYESVHPTENPNNELTSSTDSGPFDDGGQPFNLAPSKLTKTRSIKDWKLISRHNSKRRGHRRLSMEDPTPLHPSSTRFGRLNDFTDIVAQPNIVHSHSMGTDLSTRPLDSSVVNSRSNTTHAINNTGVLHTTCRIDATEHEQPLINGMLVTSADRSNGLTKDLASTGVVHQPVGYDYVRI